MFTLPDWLDLLGVICIFIAWSVLTIITFRKHKNSADPLAILFFFIGTFLFSLRAITFGGAAIFIILNSVNTTLALINWLYIPHKLKTMEKDIVSAEKTIKKTLK